MRCRGEISLYFKNSLVACLQTFIHLLFVVGSWSALCCCNCCPHDNVGNRHQVIWCAGDSKKYFWWAHFSLLHHKSSAASFPSALFATSQLYCLRSFILGCNDVDQITTKIKTGKFNHDRTHLSNITQLPRPTVCVRLPAGSEVLFYHFQIQKQLRQSAAFPEPVRLTTLLYTSGAEQLILSGQRSVLMVKCTCLIWQCLS